MPLAHSEAIGRTDLPLIEESVGGHFQAMVWRFPHREALVSRHHPSTTA